jgi:hypothetical protein
VHLPKFYLPKCLEGVFSEVREDLDSSFLPNNLDIFDNSLLIHRGFIGLCFFAG